jgi:hypothetical protein
MSTQDFNPKLAQCNWFKIQRYKFFIERIINCKNKSKDGSEGPDQEIVNFGKSSLSLRPDLGVLPEEEEEQGKISINKTFLMLGKYLQKLEFVEPHEKNRVNSIAAKNIEF